MAIQVAAALGLRTKGFMQGLASSERAYGQTMRRMARVGAAEFGKGAASGAGAFAVGSLLEKLFSKKKPASGPAGIVESMTGIDPSDPIGARSKLKNVLGAGAIALTGLGVAGVRSASRVKDFAEQADMATDDVQMLEVAARKSGQSLEKMLGLMGNIGQSRRAAGSSEEIRGLFNSFGISTEDALGSKSNLEISRMMAGRLGGRMSEKQKSDLRQLGGARAERLIGSLRNLDAAGGASLISSGNIQNIDTVGQGVKGLRRDIGVAGGNLVGGILGKIFDATPGVVGRQASKLKDKALNWIGTAGGLLPTSGTPFKPIARATGEMFGPFQDEGEQQFRDAIKIQREAEAADAYTKAAESAADVQFEQMSQTEKEVELRRRINAQLVAASHHAPGEKERADAVTAANEMKMQLAQLQRSGHTPLATDNLANVGLTTGHGGNNTVTGYLQKIAASSEQMLETLRNGP